MYMQATKHQSWRIYVHAKAKNFDLKFQCLKILPNWSIRGAQFSVLIKIRQLFLKMVFQTGSLVEKCKRERSKSRFLRILKSLVPWRIGSKILVAKRRSNIQRPKVNFPPKQQHGGLLSEEPMAAITGNLALLSSSVSQMNYGGITIHASTIFLYLILLFKNFLTRKIHFLAPLLATFASSIGFSLNYLNYKGRVSVAVWKAWNQLISFGCLYVLTQVIISRISLSIERNKLLGFVISAFLLHMSDWGGPSKGRNHAIEAAPTWTANLLIACQTFFHVLENPRDPKTLAIFMSSVHCLVKEMAHLVAPYLAT
ncbi:uncharacterized protein LOC131223842 [Magnolia sinica]|uniref:uncharacterized protein LOC131223842 n=1 Tax=Magnolia sinica TaxID=86752 RepID=UPI002659EC98|nr:uncharacterized protein LOC131223842 [Magnolia sinica]